MAARELIGRRRALASALTTMAAAVLAVLLMATLAAPAQASTRWPGHPGRRLVSYVVRPGDTATGLAVRYHAWTRELIALNGSRLRVGERIRIPVVLAAVRRAEKAGKHAHQHGTKPTRHDQVLLRQGWRHWNLPRDRVRRIVIRTARAHGVPASLALAVAWQESGWQQLRISRAGALGVMQVLPDTGRWMSAQAGRRLNLRGAVDNVEAGVRLSARCRPAPTPSGAPSRRTTRAWAPCAATACTPRPSTTSPPCSPSSAGSERAGTRPDPTRVRGPTLAA